jgi:hypothetical protein
VFVRAFSPIFRYGLLTIGFEQEGLDQGAEKIKCDKAELQKRMAESAQELNRL